MRKGFPAKSVSPLSHHCLFNFSSSIISSNNEGKNEATLFVTDLTLHGRVLEPSRCLGTVDVMVKNTENQRQPRRAWSLSGSSSFWAHVHISISSSNTLIIFFSLALLSGCMSYWILGHILLLTTFIGYFLFYQKCGAHFLSSTGLISLAHNTSVYPPNKPVSYYEYIHFQEEKIDLKDYLICSK